jgi:hypothetical protein
LIPEVIHDGQGFLKGSNGRNRVAGLPGATMAGILNRSAGIGGG